MKAKQKSKSKPKKKRNWQFESAGWLFFVVALLVLVGPITYVVLQYRSPLAKPAGLYGIGLFISMMAAGVVTWLVNSVLQWRAARVRAARDKGRTG